MSSSIASRIVKSGLVVMSPILVPMFWLLGKTYELFFGRADLRMSKDAEEKLGHEILAKLRFLFDDYNGRLSGDYTLKHPRPFDYASAIVELDSFNLRFIRGRGEFRVQLSFKERPAAWEELTTLLNIVDEGFEQDDFRSMEEAGAALEARMKLLTEAVSLTQYPQTLEKLTKAHAYERAVTRQWETEINRRLGTDK